MGWLAGRRLPALRRSALLGSRVGLLGPAGRCERGGRGGSLTVNCPEHACLEREVSQRKFEECIDFALVRFEYGGSRFIDPTTDAGDGESSGPSHAFCKQLIQIYYEDRAASSRRKAAEIFPIVGGLESPDKCMTQIATASLGGGATALSSEASSIAGAKE